MWRWLNWRSASEQPRFKFLASICRCARVRSCLHKYSKLALLFVHFSVVDETAFWINSRQSKQQCDAVCIWLIRPEFSFHQCYTRNQIISFTASHSMCALHSVQRALFTLHFVHFLASWDCRRHSMHPYEQHCTHNNSPNENVLVVFRCFALRLCIGNQFENVWTVRKICCSKRDRAVLSQLDFKSWS